MIAVITGATKGIGKAVAEQFAMAGFDLFVTARNNMDLTLMKADLEKKFAVKVYPKAADLRKKADVVLFGEFVKQNFGRLDVLVNNVGNYLPGKIFDESGDKLVEQIQVNLLSAHYLTSTLAERFKQQKSGHIFTIGSLVSRSIREDAAFYSISKQALYTWHQLLMEEMRPFNVKSTFVMPSSTYTSSWENSGVQKNELIQPDDLATAIFNCYNLKDAFVDEISVKTMFKKYD